MRSPIFSLDFLHDVDLKVPLRQQLLQPGILLLQRIVHLDLVRLHLAKALASAVHSLLAHLWRFAMSAMTALSVSNKFWTNCSPLYQIFFIAPFRLEATFSNSCLSENLVMVHLVHCLDKYRALLK